LPKLPVFGKSIPHRYKHSRHHPGAPIILPCFKTNGHDRGQPWLVAVSIPHR